VAEISIAPFLDKVSALIINPLIILVFSIAFIVFIFGIVQFINSETADKTRDEGKKKIMWGLVGMTIMFSAYGIIHLIVAAVPGARSDTGYIKF
jgi:uncharacterized membrane protein YidH (DUF202 family)